MRGKEEGASCLQKDDEGTVVYDMKMKS